MLAACGPNVTYVRHPLSPPPRGCVVISDPNEEHCRASPVRACPGRCCTRPDCRAAPGDGYLFWLGDRRPDLFGAAIVNVGVTDTLREVRVGQNGPNHYAEFGDPRTEKGFSVLRKNSAYLKLTQRAVRAAPARSAALCYQSAALPSIAIFRKSGKKFPTKKRICNTARTTLPRLVLSSYGDTI